MLHTRIHSIIFTIVVLTLPADTIAAEHPLAAIPLRSIGPALTSGRVSDFAFHPGKSHVFYVSMASGGVWKTENNGITWEPIFDEEGSFAIGVVKLDPANPNVVWVGTGENNAQRSVGYGDGVYKSVDGGNSWKNMGLKDSGHISMIRFHPENSNTVYVAAQGPLWIRQSNKRISVVFPAPLGPMMPTLSPRIRVVLKPCNTGRSSQA